MRSRFEVHVIPKEDAEQTWVIDWAHHNPICRRHLIAIPNGGSRSAKIINGKRVCLEGKRLKRMGVKEGVSDLFLAYPHKGFGGLWIEMKRREKSYLKKAQKEWLELMKSVGYATGVAYGWEDAKNQIEQYLG